MRWSEVKEIKWLKWLTNKYTLITSLFIIWMTFFDDASLLQHIRIDQEIRKLEKDKVFYDSKLKEVKVALKKIQNDPESIEKIARERFFMKKDQEDIFVVVEADSE